MRKINANKKSSEIFVDFFRDGYTHTAEELMSQLGFSRSTVVRHLKNNKALTCVNGNGQHYVLPGTIKFNKYGLGSVDGKIFSKHGNLLNTIIRLASESISGMSAGNIEKLVETNVQSQCLILFKEKKLFRKKYGKTYFYFSTEKEKREQQLSVRTPTRTQSDIDSQMKTETFDALCNTIKILVTFVRNPGFSPKSIALSLTRRGNDITTKTVMEVFDKYDLAKKNS